MNLLTPPAVNLPVQDAETLARIQAHNDKSDVEKLLAYPAKEFAARLADATENFNRVWGNPDPANILKLLGTSAGELFRLAGIELANLELLSPGCAAAITDKIKPTTTHADGTVALN